MPEPMTEDLYHLSLQRELWLAYQEEAAETPPGLLGEIHVLAYLFTQFFGLAWRSGSRNWVPP